MVLLVPIPFFHSSHCFSLYVLYLGTKTNVNLFLFNFCFGFGFGFGSSIFFVEKMCNIRLP